MVGETNMVFGNKTGALLKLILIVVLFDWGTSGFIDSAKAFADVDEGIPEILRNTTASSPRQSINNFDKDFLAKQVVEPLEKGFMDPLFIPAKMSRLASGSLLNGVTSAGSRLIAVGIRGHIMSSDDMGKTWIQKKVPLSLDLMAVHFPTGKHGWVVGQDGIILNSTDGGETWAKQMDGYKACRILNDYYKKNSLYEGLEKDAAQKVSSDIQFMVEQGPVNPFFDVWFENKNTGFVVGAFNLIYRTDDGGKTWKPLFDRTENPNGMHLYDIEYADGDIYISGEQGLLLKYDPEKNYFNMVKTPYNGTFFGILGKPGVVMVFGLRGNVFRSVTRGATWQKVDAGVFATILGGTIRKADGAIILVTQAGGVLISENDGKNFTALRKEAGTGIPTHSVTSADNDTIVMAGWYGVQLLENK